MHFYPNQLFHIYNQGNNHRQLFFSEKHYKYFLWKMRAYLLPFGDLISYCLMPNHFHWQFFLKDLEIDRMALNNRLDEVEALRRNVYGNDVPKTTRAAVTKKKVTINESIGRLQKSYTQALNKERNWSGSLFRKPCQAKDGWEENLLSISAHASKNSQRFVFGTSYAYQCLSYIHDNPKVAGLVEVATDWPYSSAQDYAGIRNGNLCNLKMGRELMNFV